MQEEIEKYINQVKSETDVFNKAKLLEFLRRKKDIPLKTLSEKLKITSSYLSQIMRLVRIPEIIMDGYYSNTISLSHLLIISRIKDKEKIIKIYEKILAENLTTTQTEPLVRDTIYGIKTTNRRLSEEEKKVIIDKINRGNKEVKVTVTQTRIKSKVIIEIKTDLEKASNILKKLF